MSTMVIVCEECSARFRLDKALLKDSKAVRVRCRKCGGYIVVRVPEEPPAPEASPPPAAPVTPDWFFSSGPPAAPSPVAEAPLSPPPVVAEEAPSPPKPVMAPESDPGPPAGTVPAVPTAVAPPSASMPPPGAEFKAPDMVGITAMLEEMVDELLSQPSPPAAPGIGELRPEGAGPSPTVTEASPEGPTAFEADISGMVRSEPIPSPPDEMAVSPDTVSIEPEQKPAQPGKMSTRPEDLFAFPPEKDAGPDRIPLPPEEHPAGEKTSMETAATEPERIPPSSRAPSMLAVLVISVFWVLLLAAGALYFGTMKSGQGRLGQTFASWGSARTGSAPERPVYDIRDVKWYVDKSSAGGSLFVIKGAVANVGKVPSAGIRIQATLLGKDNEAIAEKAAFAGNLLDETVMRRMERAGIEGIMSNRFGDGNVNREIPAGKALPFMVVFFDAPGKIDGFKVNAVDAD